MRITLLVLTLMFSTNVFARKTITLTSSNSVVMNQAFHAGSVAKIQQQLGNLANKTKGDLYIVLDSPGGSISAGKDLIFFAKSLPNKVHTISLFAASMAYITAQHLGKRYVTTSGSIMSHRARIGGLGGQVPGEANSRLKYISRIVREISIPIAKRVGVTYKDYLNSIYDELWLTGRQAVSKGHADELVNLRCGKSRQGTYVTPVRTLFGTYYITFSKCPLIKGPLKIDTKNNHIHKAIERLFNYSAKKNFILTL